MTKAKNLSRRALMKNVGAMAAAASLGTSALSAQSSSVRGGARAIALIGDRAHNSDYIRVSLDRLFSELAIPIDYTTNFYDLSASFLQPYQLFVCFRDNVEQPMDPERIGRHSAAQPGLRKNKGKPFRILWRRETVFTRCTTTLLSHDLQRIIERFRVVSP